MNKERIEDAIDIMSSLPDRRLNMQLWQQTEPQVVISQEEGNECGTICCFAGHVALSPMFQEFGGSVDFDGSPKIRRGRGRGEERGKSSELAIASYFDIPYKLAYHLCHPPKKFYGDVKTRDIKPHHVVKALQNLLTNGDSNETRDQSQMDRSPPIWRL